MKLLSRDLSSDFSLRCIFLPWFAIGLSLLETIYRGQDVQ